MRVHESIRAHESLIPFDRKHSCALINMNMFKLFMTVDQSQGEFFGQQLQEIQLWAHNKLESAPFSYDSGCLSPSTLVLGLFHSFSRGVQTPQPLYVLPFVPDHVGGSISFRRRLEDPAEGVRGRAVISMVRISFFFSFVPFRLPHEILCDVLQVIVSGLDVFCPITASPPPPPPPPSPSPPSAPFHKPARDQPLRPTAFVHFFALQATLGMRGVKEMKALLDILDLDSSVYVRIQVSKFAFRCIYAFDLNSCLVGVRRKLNEGRLQGPFSYSLRIQPSPHHVLVR